MKIKNRRNVTYRMINKGHALTDEDYAIWTRHIYGAPDTYRASVATTFYVFSDLESRKLATGNQR
jgi:hypothetical protein